MAGTHGSSTDPVNLNDPEVFFRELAEAPWRFDFFQVMRRIECLYPKRPRLGQGEFPEDEPLRLGQRPSLAFAPSALAGFQPEKDGQPGLLEVLFFGMLGPNGPLPLHLTEYARERLRSPNNDPTFARFLDIFHHRLLLLFYRAWADALPTVSFDRPSAEADRFGIYLASLIGYGEPSLRDRDAMPDLAKLHYAGHFACGIRHPAGLQAVIEDFFGLSVSIQEFTPRWLDLPPEQYSRLGLTGVSLGHSAVAGVRVWDCQHNFRVRLGPLSLADYQRLLPGGESLERLVAVVRNYLDDGLHWDLQLVLRHEQVPSLCLNSSVQLGWTSWLGDPRRDTDDLCLDAAARVAAMATMTTPPAEAAPAPRPETDAVS